MKDMLPDRETKCHRTGFEKTCFQCVVDHKCRLWKRITLECDPETGKAGVDHYDCLDSLQDIYAKDALRRQVQTTASIDSLRKEVAQSNDSGMTSALMGINAHVRRLADAQGAAGAAMIGHHEHDPQKLLETH